VVLRRLLASTTRAAADLMTLSEKLREIYPSNTENRLEQARALLGCHRPLEIGEVPYGTGMLDWIGSPYRTTGRLLAAKLEMRRPSGVRPRHHRRSAREASFNATTSLAEVPSFRAVVPDHPSGPGITSQYKGGRESLRGSATATELGWRVLPSADRARSVCRRIAPDNRRTAAVVAEIRRRSPKVSDVYFDRRIAPHDSDIFVDFPSEATTQRRRQKLGLGGTVALVTGASGASVAPSRSSSSTRAPRFSCWAAARRGLPSRRRSGREKGAVSWWPT
jgi:hypothetical protein